MLNRIRKQLYCLIVITLLCGVWGHPCAAAPLAITPFYTFNQSPLVQIFGLPAAENAMVQPAGHLWSLLAVDVANNFAVGTNSRENILLDGESYRTTLALRYGISDRLEMGLDVPLVGYGGGVFDGFIEDWHRFFGLPRGERPSAPHNRLLFTYSRDGQEKLRLDDSNFGLGDIRLTGGWQIYNNGKTNPRSVALRASLKLPTGSSSKLHGSGSTDIALWFTGSDDYQLPGAWGHFTFFGAAGGMAMTGGQVLEEQQQDFAGFGSLGFGWSPADWIALKSQLSFNTPFYRGSDLGVLEDMALQLLIGGTLAFSPKTALDIAVSEDLSVATSPDVVLHLGLSHRF